jgi:hypothetical protein
MKNLLLKKLRFTSLSLFGSIFLFGGLFASPLAVLAFSFNVVSTPNTGNFQIIENSNASFGQTGGLYTQQQVETGWGNNDGSLSDCFLYADFTGSAPFNAATYSSATPGNWTHFISRQYTDADCTISAGGLYDSNRTLSGTIVVNAPDVSMMSVVVSSGTETLVDLVFAILSFILLVVPILLGLTALTVFIYYIPKLKERILYALRKR